MPWFTVHGSLDRHNRVTYLVPSMSKILLAVTYTKHNWVDGFTLLDAIADTQSEESELADLLIYPQVGLGAPDSPLIEKLKTKFRSVFILRSQRRSSPPNDPDFPIDRVRDRTAAYNLILGDLLRDSAIYSGRYKAVLHMHPTACPVNREWLTVMDKQWDDHQAKILGAWSPRNTLVGNPTDCLGFLVSKAMMFAPDLAAMSPGLIDTPSGHYWDTWHAKTLHELGWQGTYAVKSLPAHSAMSEDLFNEIRNERAVIVNGLTTGGGSFGLANSLLHAS